MRFPVGTSPNGIGDRTHRGGNAPKIHFDQCNVYGKSSPSSWRNRAGPADTRKGKVYRPDFRGIRKAHFSSRVHRSKGARVAVDFGFDE
jgi:hypothetical protein